MSERGAFDRRLGVLSSSDVCGGVGGNPPAGRVASIVQKVQIDN